MMRSHSLAFCRETKRDGDLEVLERSHLSIEALLRAGPHAVGPAQTCPNMSNRKRLQPLDRVMQAMIFEMKPLTDSEHRRHVGGMPRASFGVPSSRNSPMYK
jgi:hypothetical protein